MSQVVVVVGGGPLTARATTEIVADATIIAADSGLDHAVAAGLRPDVLVGDLDSISAHGKMWAYAHELEIEAHDPDKDATDTELALLRAIATGATDLLVVGGFGERFDHALAIIAALGHPRLEGFETVRCVIDDAAVHVIHGPRSVTIDLARNTLFSLLAMHGPCRGVDVTGAQWPLTDAELAPFSTRGISNATTDLLHIAVTHGILTLVVP